MATTFAEGSPEYAVQQKYMRVMDMVFDQVASPLLEAEESLRRVHEKLQLTPVTNVHQPARANTSQGVALQRLLTKLRYIVDQSAALERHLEWMVHVPEPEILQPQLNLNEVPEELIPADDRDIDDLLDSIVNEMEPPPPPTEMTPEGSVVAVASPVAAAAPAAVKNAPIDDDDIDVGIVIPPAKPKPTLSFQGMPMAPEEIEEFKAFQIWKYENEQRENLLILRKRKVEEYKKAHGM